MNSKGIWVKLIAILMWHCMTSSPIHLLLLNPNGRKTIIQQQVKRIIKKIHQSLNEIYNEQISKHKDFIKNDKEKLSYILEGKVSPDEISDDPDILYIAVDKRSQLFIEDRLLVPLNGMLALINVNSQDGVLNLDKIVKSLREQKSRGLYINTEDDFSEFKVSEDITIVTQDLYSI
ncbi:hypothetical protein ACT7DZ_03390 [Bacillus cereus]